MKSPDSRTPCILIADDQPDVLEALRFLVKGEGYQAESVNSPAAAIDAVESRDFDVVLMDLNYTRDTTSGQEGLELLNRIQRLDTTLPVIVMTAWGRWNWRWKRCGAARAISSRSRGTTRGFRRFSRRRSNWAARCGKASGWRRRTARCAPNAFRN